MAAVAMFPIISRRLEIAADGGAYMEHLPAAGALGNLPICLRKHGHVTHLLSTDTSILLGPKRAGLHHSLSQLLAPAMGRI
jgi:hypothetical protein